VCGCGWEENGLFWSNSGGLLAIPVCMLAGLRGRAAHCAEFWETRGRLGSFQAGTVLVGISNGVIRTDRDAFLANI
jgi:hypothetical protein